MIILIRGSIKRESSWKRQFVRRWVVFMTWVQINTFSGQTVNHSRSPAATAATPHGQLRAQTGVSGIFWRLNRCHCGWLHPLMKRKHSSWWASSGIVGKSTCPLWVRSWQPLRSRGSYQQARTVQWELGHSCRGTCRLVFDRLIALNL